MHQPLKEGVIEGTKARRPTSNQYTSVVILSEGWFLL
jgi:hypothetical protein